MEANVLAEEIEKAHWRKLRERDSTSAPFPESLSPMSQIKPIITNNKEHRIKLILHKNHHEYLVPSEKDAHCNYNVIYSMVKDTWTCNCESFKFHKKQEDNPFKCKHILKLSPEEQKT